MDQPYIQNPFPPPPRRIGSTLLFFSIAAIAIVGCGYLVWMIVAPESTPTLSAPRPNAAAESEIVTMVAQLGIFQKSVGRYPTVGEGLNALVEKPPGMPKETPWPKLRTSIPRDPWGRAYQYEETPDNPPGYRVFSRGPNVDDPSDDISQTLPSVAAPETPAATAAPSGAPKFR